MVLFHAPPRGRPSRRHIFLILLAAGFLMNPRRVSAQAMTEYMMLQGQVQKDMQQGIATATASSQQQATASVQEPIQADSSAHPARPGGITVTFTPVHIGVILTLGALFWMFINK